jgi:PKD domain
LATIQLLAPHGSEIPSISPIAATGVGSNFDHVVIIAMENKNYATVLGSGTLATCPTGTAPFLCSLLPFSSTVPNYHSYGASSRITGCSAACYVSFMAGDTYGVSDGYGALNVANLVGDRFPGAGLTWRAYCEAGCPRGNDHFPFSSFADTQNSPNVFTSSSVSTTSFIAAANLSNPPNLLWFTPTDSHNMHDDSITSGDSFLQSFLIGSGSITNPSSGSLLASNVFSTAFHTILYIWWDEFDPSPNIIFGTGIKHGFVSTANNYDEYSSLHMIEANWGLTALTSHDSAAPTMSDLFGTILPPPPTQLSTSFSFTPSNPIVQQTITFTATATGGTLPYSFSWVFGDGTTGSGATVSHSYKTTGTFRVTQTVSDSVAATASSTLSVSVAPPPPPPSTGVFDNNWFINNCGGAGGGTETIASNGTLTLREQVTGGNDTIYGFCTAQRGTFPWGSTQGTNIPSNITSVSSSVNFLGVSLTSGSRYHLYVALYYQLPSGTVCPTGGTGADGACWLDTQSRVVFVNGGFEPVGTVETYTAQAVGYGLTSAIITPGTTGTIVANVASQCQGGLAAWGLPTTTQCTLMGVEIGTEGFQFNELDTNWIGVTLNTGSAAPSFTLTSNVNKVALMQTFSQNLTLTLASLAGFTGTVSLTRSVDRLGVTVTLGNTILSVTSGSTTKVPVNIITTNTTSLGSYTLTITATSASLKQSVRIPLRVNTLGDIDGNGIVNIVDVSVLLYQYNTTPSSPNWNPLADLNHNGVVDIRDVAIIFTNYDKTTP